MSTLTDYLGHKREAIIARKARVAAGESGPNHPDSADWTGRRDGLTIARAT